MSTWWRAYNSSLHHRKLLKLSDAMHRAWYTLQCIASENGGTLPPAADIAVTLRITEAKVAEWITKLVQAELYDNNDGVFSPHNWETRQYKTDAKDPTGAKRAKKYRDAKRDGRDASRTVTRDETVRDERPEQSRAESEAEQSRANAARLKNEIEEKWGFLDTTRVDVWLATGYTETLIVATMTELLARKPGINGLAYFDAALAEGHAKRPISRAETAAAIDWDGTIKLFVKTGVWSRWVGPEPGAAGSKAPHDILAKHGLGPDGQKLKVTA